MLWVAWKSSILVSTQTLTIELCKAFEIEAEATVISRKEFSSKKLFCKTYTRNLEADRCPSKEKPVEQSALLIKAMCIVLSPSWSIKSWKDHCIWN